MVHLRGDVDVRGCGVFVFRILDLPLINPVSNTRLPLGEKNGIGIFMFQKRGMWSEHRP